MSIQAYKKEVKELKRRIKVMRAFKKGKAIEYCAKNSEQSNWNIIVNPGWYWESINYRIKPTIDNFTYEPTSTLDVGTASHEAFEACHLLSGEHITNVTSTNDILTIKTERTVKVI